MKKKRIEVIDALRGFAILSILLIHTSNHFLYGKMCSTSSSWLHFLDEQVYSTLYFLFEGKAYSIFALLFGFTMGLLLDRGRVKSKFIEGRMWWRMCGLMIFGIWNAMWFAGGDPLVFYALLMIFVIPLGRLETKVLFILGVFFLLQPFEILNEIIPFKSEVCGELYKQLHRVLEQGNWWSTSQANIQIGLPACLWWAWESGRASQTLGLFCMGMIAYRIHFFQRSVSQYRTILFVTFPICVALGWVRFYILPYSIPVQMYYNMIASFFLISLFCWGYYCTSSFRIWRLLALYGRMSLTHFIVQSLFGAFLFYPWGLHCKLGVIGSLGIALIFFSIQLCMGKWWLKHYAQGLLEWFWKRMTWIGNK